MKLITCYINPKDLNSVKEVLYGKNISRFSVADVFGHSDEVGVQESYRGVGMEVDLHKKIRIDIAINDDFKETVVSSLLEAAKEKKFQEGKIFVTPIEECFRLVTGESGIEAIG